MDPYLRLRPVGFDELGIAALEDCVNDRGRADVIVLDIALPLVSATSRSYGIARRPDARAVD